MTTAPFWEEDPWDEEIREREGWYDDLDVETLRDLQMEARQRRRQVWEQQEYYRELVQAQRRLDDIYGRRSTALSRKARAQPRNKKGQFTAKRYVRPRDARGRFIKAPRRIRWAPPTTIRVVPSTAAYVADIWQPTQTTTGTWVPVNNYYTVTTGTGGTLTADNPVMWDTCRNEQTTTTTYTNGNMQYTIADEQGLQRQHVTQRWHTIAERDQQVFIRDEEYAALRRREDAERQRYADERQRQREEQNRRRLADMRRLEGAQQRALELLKMILSPEERTYWENTGDIRVTGSDGGMYVICASEEVGSVHGNIKVTDAHGCTLGSICVAPTMYDRDENGRQVSLPLADGWVGQYLTLKHNEGEMLRHANWYRQRECQHPGIPVLGHGQAAVA